ncbi:hypothetical protein HMPREF9078_01941 [Capnocytophaga sp. oral taxon 380 str. F0488]|nr:hypothetical protein HMPREF9078_01941 [Capnocytophaga sp. oral taxon 380 str. F0488]
MIGEKIFCSSFLYLPVQLAPSFIHCRATVDPLKSLSLFNYLISFV